MAKSRCSRRETAHRQSLNLYCVIHIAVATKCGALDPVKHFRQYFLKKSLAPVVGPNTAIITFQNGVEGVDILQARFGKSAVLPGVTYIGALVEAPGHIRQIGTVNRSLFGEPDGGALWPPADGGAMDRQRHLRRLPFRC